LLAGSGIELLTYDAYADPVEGVSSYFDNARLKARALWEQLRAAGMTANVLADDSGLEVRALDGKPGVATADYGGPGLSWAQRRAALLDELRQHGAVDRRCRFVCALHYVAVDEREIGTFATVEGEVATEDRGGAGFSFDPIFVYPPAGKTFAELSDAEKNAVSHRATALAGLLGSLPLRGGAAAREKSTPTGT
jgi:XTP/dITP diphosphohydrolase